MEGGGSKAPTGPAARRDRPGATAVPACPGVSVLRGGQGFGCAQNTNEASRGPRLCPQWARTGRGPSPTPPFAAHPPPRAGARAGGAGGASSGFAARAPRLARSPACASPRARRPGRSLPARPQPAAPPAYPRRAGGTALRAPSRFLLRALGPARLRGAAGASPGLASPGRPGTEAAAGARSAAALRGAGCHDCGQRDARAHARAGLGDSGPTDGPWPDRSPVCAADGGQSRQARPCGGKCAPWGSRQASGTELGVVGGSGLPPGQGACQGDPAAASRTPQARRSEGRGAQWGRGRGARDLVKWRGAAHCAQRYRVYKVPRGGGPPCARVAVRWREHSTQSRCPAPSSLSSFPAETTSCSLGPERRSCGETF